MRRATIQSVCECQAHLAAKLDEQRNALEGVATSGADRERAPAHSIHPESARFDVAWYCPFCNRNTLRSFAADALVWTELPEPVPATTPAT